MKHCNGCDTDKFLDKFYFYKTGRRTGKPFSRCIECKNKVAINWVKSNPEKVHIWKKANREKTNKNACIRRYNKGGKSVSENKSCSSYLGCIIAETVLSHEFPGFKRMPYGNPGYDYECPKGFKIDVKSSCRRHIKNKNDNWHFYIRYNKIANYFLFLAFDDRESLTPEHIWLIPGCAVNDKQCIGIADSPKILTKWSQYERPLENVMKCCNKLRES